MNRRRLAAYACLIAEALADARDELEAAQFDELLEHVLAVLAEEWAAHLARTAKRAA